MEKLEFEYVVEEKDYLNFSITEILPESMRIIGSIFAGLAFFSICFNKILWNLTTGQEFKISDFFPMIFAILFLLYYYYNIKKRFHSFREFKTPIKCQLTLKNISFEGNGFDSKIDWLNIKKVRNKKNYFLVFPSDRIAFIVSKSKIPEEKLSQIVSFFSQIPNLNFK